MVVLIAGQRMYLWRAVDDEGEVLDMLVQRRRDTRSALRLMRKLLKKQGFVPKCLVTDKLRSYASAFRHCPRAVLGNGESLWAYTANSPAQRIICRSRLRHAPSSDVHYTPRIRER